MKMAAVKVMMMMMMQMITGMIIMMKVKMMMITVTVIPTLLCVESPKRIRSMKQSPSPAVSSSSTLSSS